IRCQGHFVVDGLWGGSGACWLAEVAAPKAFGALQGRGWDTRTDKLEAKMFWCLWRDVIVMGRRSLARLGARQWRRRHHRFQGGLFFDIAGFGKRPGNGWRKDSVLVRRVSWPLFRCREHAIVGQTPALSPPVHRGEASDPSNWLAGLNRSKKPVNPVSSGFARFRSGDMLKWTPNRCRVVPLNAG